MNTTRMFVRFVCALALVAAVPAGAAVLDQDFVTTDNPANNTGLGIVTTSLGQTFTVGISGTLAAVEFNILKFSGTTGNLTVDIRTLGGGGAPEPLAASALGSFVVDNADITAVGGAGFTTILVDVSAASIGITAGDMLAFVLSSPIGESFAVQTDYLNGYAGGIRWSQNGDGNVFSSSASADLAFKTYVDAANVPEPAALQLLLLGLGALGWMRRKRA